MSLVTDLNTRERTRYTRGLRELAEGAELMATAIEIGDDTAALFHLVKLAIVGDTIMRELVSVFKDANEVRVPADLSTLKPDTPS